MTDRYVVLGLAPVRAPWFDEVSQWAHSATIAIEFVKCVSGEEMRSRLAGGRRYSALLVDARSAATDPDVVDAAVEAGVAVLVVGWERGAGSGVGVGTVLPDDFSPRELLDALSAHSSPVATAAGLPPILHRSDEPDPWASPLYAVCGPGGTGASTVAASLAQGLAADPRHGRLVLLADMALRADQAVLHDSVDLGPGLQELVEAHRSGRPSADDVVAHTFDVPRRGYALLLGLRQQEAWSALRPRAIDAALAALRRAFRVVVADISGDFEGEAETGSPEIEERNHLARSAAREATVTVAVGNPGLKGVHSLTRLVVSMVRAGVPEERIVTVVNRSPRHPAARAESSRALARLLEGYGISVALASPVQLPERKLEPLLRDGAPLPGALVDPVTKAVAAVAERAADYAPAWNEPERVVPGSLGSWSQA